MKRHLFFILLMTSFCTDKKQESEDLFTIYLVRHAEKDLGDKNNKNPALTACGQLRADSFANFFQTIPFDAIYSSDYKRTLETAKPTAISKNLEITIYHPGQLDSFSKLLLSKKENALVVGHSNTTGVLAGLLCNQEIGFFDESSYNRIYQVVIHKNTGRLHRFNTSFACDEAM